MLLYLLPSLIAAVVASAPTFDPLVGNKFLLYAYAAYNVPQPGEWNCPYCINATRGMVPTADCHNIEAGSQSYVGYNSINNEIVVSFRGSSNFQNWYLDLQFVKTPPNASIPGVDPSVQVEEGFWKFYESVQTCVRKEVSKLVATNPTATVAITGHSLGASAASLCALDLYMNDNVKNIQLVTFGEPRTGNPGFQAAMAKAFPTKFRVVNYQDCVPHLPPQQFGYKHTAYEVFEHPSGAWNFTVCDGTGEDKMCSDQFEVKVNCEEHLDYYGIECCDHPYSYDYTNAV